MDFKVAGTADGVTAIQMDIKVAGITSEIMRRGAGAGERRPAASSSARWPRRSRSRATELSRVRAACDRLKINPEKIGAVIGPGGKMIRSIQEETGTKIDIEDDGTVSIASTDPSGAEAAIQRIHGSDPGDPHRDGRDLQRQGRQHHAVRRLRRAPSRPGRSRSHLGALRGSGDARRPGRGCASTSATRSP